MTTTDNERILDYESIARWMYRNGYQNDVWHVCDTFAIDGDDVDRFHRACLLYRSHDALTVADILGDYARPFDDAAALAAFIALDDNAGVKGSVYAQIMHVARLQALYGYPPSTLTLMGFVDALKADGVIAHEDALFGVARAVRLLAARMHGSAGSEAA